MSETTLSIRDALRNFVVGIFNYEETGTWPDNGTLRTWAKIGRDALNASPIARNSDEPRQYKDAAGTEELKAEIAELRARLGEAHDELRRLRDAVCAEDAAQIDSIVSRLVKAAKPGMITRQL